MMRPLAAEAGGVSSIHACIARPAESHELYDANQRVTARTMRLIPFAFLACALSTNAAGQQVPDTVFRFQNPRPAFAEGSGPVLCVDAAHRNSHTLDGTYYAFGRLAQQDGFRTATLREMLDAGVPADCGVVVIANAATPLAENEVGQLLTWIIAGGRLLLVMDHAPYPRFVERLSTALGAAPFNGGANYRMFGAIPDHLVRTLAERSRITVDSMRRMLGPPGALGDHPILRGRRGVDPSVNIVDTFGGSLFYAAAGVTPLLSAPAGAIGEVWWPDRFSPADEPRYPLGGWLVAGAGEPGRGRVVILGEAAMCSAQLAGPERTPMGMNAPLAVDNAQFCLNVIRWLVGVI